MASTGEVWKLGHRPALDGVRGIAVMLVVLCHAYPDWIPGGGAVGVSVFFTLSGFLITGLLLDEYDQNRRIRVASFYRRRACRLLPALGAFLVVMLILGAFVSDWYANPMVAAAAVLYGVNWLTMNGWHVGGLDHTWSLSVEEQFYILFPWVLVGLVSRGSRRALFVAVSVAAIVSLAARLWLIASGAPGDRIYYGTDMNVGLLFLGCAGAVAMTIWCPKASHPRVAHAAMGAVVVLALVETPAGRTIVPMIASGLALVAILCSMGGSCTSTLLSARSLAALGRRSYALYLWHFPLTMATAPAVAEMYAWSETLVRAAAVGAAWGLTCLSWRFVERPFMTLRDGEEIGRPRAAV